MEQSNEIDVLTEEQLIFKFMFILIKETNDFMSNNKLEDDPSLISILQGCAMQYLCIITKMCLMCFPDKKVQSDYIDYLKFSIDKYLTTIQAKL